MMLRAQIHAVLAGVATLSLGSSSAIAADQAKIDQVIEVVERFCLSGKGFQLTANAGGRVTFKKLAPGADGNLDVDIKKTSGGVGYLNEQLRILVDADTRACMQPYINKVVDLVLTN